MSKNNPHNNPKRWMIVSIIITLISIVMVFFGVVLNDFNFFWMILVGLLLGITFGIFIVVFYKQSKLLDDMFQNVDGLAHWTFEKSEQLEKAESEFNERKSINKILIGIMTFFFVLIGGFFLVFAFDDADEALIFALIFFSVLAILFVVAFTVPRISYKRMKTAVPEVFVGPYSAWIMGEYTQWAAPMTRITGVSFVTAIDGEVRIEVHFEIYQRSGPQFQDCRIPVPAGKEAEAETVAQQIASINHVDFNISQA